MGQVWGRSEDRIQLGSEPSQRGVIGIHLGDFRRGVLQLGLMLPEQPLGEGSAV